MSIEETLCPECNGPMQSRNGKYGVFWGCKNYPECKGTRDSMGRCKAERETERDTERQKEADKENNDRYRFRKS